MFCPYKQQIIWLICEAGLEGYLSEAGASYIDTKLGLNVVPPTGVVALAAPSFNYGKFDRAKARTKQTISNKWRKMARVFKRTGLPSKVGSLQVFVNGYEDACIMLRKWELKEEELPEFSNKHFLIQFQKLIILDYIIRNTDRGNDNWLIKCVMASGNNESIKADSIPINSNPAQVEDLIDLGNNEDKLNKEAVNATDRNNGETENGAEGLDISIDQSDIFKIIAKDQVNKGFAVSEPSSESEYQLLRDIEHSKCPKYFIAAIDNGLAFPFKHPDEFRGYPYGWAYLPFARIAFLPEITAKFVPLLENAYFVQEMCEELKQIFMKDSNFDKTFFSRQMSVMRGQIFNLKEALKVGKTPYDLCLMTPQYMCEVKIKKQKGRKGQKLRVPVGGNNGREDANTAQNGEAHPNSYIDLDNDSQPGTSRNSSATNNNTWSRLYAQRVQIRKPFFKFW
uniref:Phosphatidylinositol 4-kinase type 2 n=1 Tax=Rhabditophanes sp. KR3021 TaxID=114890 RepID=A0AC35U6Y9_9BILA